MSFAPRPPLPGRPAIAAPAVAVAPIGSTDVDAALRAQVLASLERRPRTIPTAFLYDDRGSALYDAVTETEDYYLARSEARLLRAIGLELQGLVRPAELVELGSGSSRKTRWVLEAVGAGARPLLYRPIDVNRSFLLRSGRALAAAYPGLGVAGMAGTFEEAVAALPMAGDRLFLFLGGTVGNLTPAEEARLFRAMAGRMGPRSHLLLGFDLRAHARKPVALIERAYNDRQGRMAACHLNVLRRLNRELGADFRTSRWAYRGTYDAGRHVVDLAIVSLADQVVRAPGLLAPLEFRAGERVRTAISRKFDPDALVAGFRGYGFRPVRIWTDPARRVGLALLAGPWTAPALTTP